MTQTSWVLSKLFLLLALLALCLVWPADRAFANGSHEDSIEAYYGSVGDLVVRVEAIPIVGDLHLVVYLREKDDTPVQGAEVQATGVGPGADPIMIGPAVNLPQSEYDLSLYSVTLLGALEEGVWDIDLRIVPEGWDEAEALTVDFPIELSKPSSYNELMIAVLAAFVLFLAWMVFSWRRQAARRRRGG